MLVSLISIIYIFTVPPFLSLTGKLKCEEPCLVRFYMSPRWPVKTPRVDITAIVFPGTWLLATFYLKMKVNLVRKCRNYTLRNILAPRFLILEYLSKSRMENELFKKQTYFISQNWGWWIWKYHPIPLYVHSSIHPFIRDTYLQYIYMACVCT